jgi:long-subunit fatty acid transport protein
MYFGTNKISEKFSIHSELQYRNHTISPTNIEQLLLRTGLNYHFKPNASATFGYAHIGNHIYESVRKSPETEEHRIWQQLLTTNNIGRVKFEHRYRLEERFAESDFKMRFRYRLMLFVPLNRPKIETGTMYLGFYDEIFINDKATFFDRNRLYGGLGYQHADNIHFQVGVLRQETQTASKTFLQFGLIFTTDLRTKKNQDL